MRSPYRWFKDLVGEIDRGMEDMRDLSFKRWEGRMPLFVPWAPPVEVFTRSGDLVVRAELPGLKSDEVDLTLADGVLIFSGERKVDPEEQSAGPYRIREPRYGPFRRSIALPEDFERSEAIHTKFEYGVLEVTIRGAAAVAGRIRVEPSTRTPYRD